MWLPIAPLCFQTRAPRVDLFATVASNDELTALECHIALEFPQGFQWQWHIPVRINWPVLARWKMSYILDILTGMLKLLALMAKHRGITILGTFSSGNHSV